MCSFQIKGDFRAKTKYTLVTVLQKHSQVFTDKTTKKDIA